MAILPPPTETPVARPTAAQPIPTPLGLLVAVASDAWLLRLKYADQDQAVVTAAAETTAGNAVTRRTSDQLGEYFAGQRTAFDLPLGPLEESCGVGTAFQRRVWRALMAIPYGRTISYRQLAEAIDQPKASRAVGSANGKNPLSIITPCHRVIATDGGLGGYTGGLRRKEQLLEHEGARLF
ncbi:methylated-DNA--[protein]-cysteine S-methyltransferase [Pseudobythopirellula maris]|nr:methylated-DNA--[protein]-cysteine S-methyltransferase [Pseudobythopirellula maris]